MTEPTKIDSTNELRKLVETYLEKKKSLSEVHRRGKEDLSGIVEQIREIKDRDVQVIKYNGTAYKLCKSRHGYWFLRQTKEEKATEV